jgi:hypothetical protein
MVSGAHQASSLIRQCVLEIWLMCPEKATELIALALETATAMWPFVLRRTRSQRHDRNDALALDAQTRWRSAKQFEHRRRAGTSTAIQLRRAAETAARRVVTQEVEIIRSWNASWTTCSAWAIKIAPGQALTPVERLVDCDSAASSGLRAAYQSAETPRAQDKS